jgi:hypothetical protein
VQSGITAGG